MATKKNQRNATWKDALAALFAGTGSLTVGMRDAMAGHGFTGTPQQLADPVRRKMLGRGLKYGQENPLAAALQTYAVSAGVLPATMLALPTGPDDLLLYGGGAAAMRPLLNFMGGPLPAPRNVHPVQRPGEMF